MDDISHCQVRSCEPKSDEFELVLPGSFNPLHQGHLAMADHAAKVYGAGCCFELSVANVDKPQLSIEEVQRRMDQPFGSHGLIISNAARFVEKSTIYRGGVFVVGADTLIRLDDVRYYEDSQQKRDDSIGKIADNGCRFLVFGRMIANKFVDSENLNIGVRLRGLCEFVSQNDFDMSISSTQIRDANGSGQRSDN